MADHIYHPGDDMETSGPPDDAIEFDFDDATNNGGGHIPVIRITKSTVTKAARKPTTPKTSPAPPSVTSCTLASADTTFRKWLGPKYDLDVLHAVLATAATHHLPGDPLWMFVVGGSGNTKTETVQSLHGAGALVTSTISSEGALLSGTARRDKAKNATGGLLRRIGSHGLLVIKDGGSILVMNSERRSPVLAGLREVYDGRWERNIGTDGGRSELWEGRLTVVGAVTTAWDRAHDVTASLGDRFVLVRMDSTTGRIEAGQRACHNSGDEPTMRRELAAAVGGVLATITPTAVIHPTDTERDRLLAAADVVTRARTGVDFDYRGDVIDAHAPEMPTRFMKQLTQLMRGAVLIGLDRAEAVRLAIRCARDSMPPIRLAILDDIAAHPHSSVRDVRRRIDKPHTTVTRQLEALHILQVLTCDEIESASHDASGKFVTRWYYSLAEGIHPDVLT
jgi:hypothetical protein